MKWRYVFISVRIMLLLLAVAALLIISAAVSAGQKQPEVKRVAQIHDALNAHGYATGSTWPQVQEACRKIADEHGWQVNRAPDARVLILLGLGNEHSNPYVATQPGGMLDKEQRHEGMEK
jgi:hypothetical protein